MKAKIYLLLFLTLLFGKSYSQTVTTQSTPIVTTVTPQVTVAPVVTPVVVKGGPNRPSGQLGIIEIDNYVTNCYNLYDQTNSISGQLNTLEQQVFASKTKDIMNGNTSYDAQLRSMNTQVVTLNQDGLLLAQSGSEMTDKVTKDLEAKPLKIPGAIIRVKNASKAVKLSLESIHTMTHVTIVNIENKLHPKKGTDSTQNKMATAPVPGGKAAKTVIKISGMDFSTFSSFFTELSGMPGIKSTDKKFNLSGTSSINAVFYGSSDDLLTAILANCKDVVSGKNVGSTEKGKITLQF